MTQISVTIYDFTIFILAKACQKADGQFKAMLRPYNLTNLQHLVLEGLWIKEGITAADLGKLLILDKAGRHDGSERSPDPDDGRIFRLHTSEKAVELKQQLIDLRTAASEDCRQDSPWKNRFYSNLC